jgi:kynurenine formamidase
LGISWAPQEERVGLGRGAEDASPPVTVAGRTLYDLTQPLGPRSPRSSDHPQVRFESLRWRSRNGNRTSTLSTSVHVGTHVDAPNLYYPFGDTIDKVPLDRLCGTAVVLDVTRDDWGEISAADLAAQPMEVRPGDIVILRTGWHRFFEDEERYILKPPGLTRDGVDWLAARYVKMVGADSPSPEHIFMRSRYWRELRADVFGGLSIDPTIWPASYGHKTLLAQGICLLEGLGGQIDQIVGTRVELLALPLMLDGVEAAQARVVALA